jgi:branched-chain amino acid transport system substrate-binding protein
MRQRTGGSLAALATAVLLVAGCGGTGSGGAATSGTAPVKLGVVLEITGAAASIGGGERDAVQLAVAKANESGGINHHDVQLVIRDAQSREDQAAKYASLLIGSTRSGPSLAMRPIAEQAKVPMISLAAAEQVTKGSRWVFKSPPSDRVVIAQLVQYLAAQGYHRIGLLRDSSAFGEGVADDINASGATAGVKVAIEEKFDPTATDFTGQLIKLRATALDATIIWGSAAAPALATKQYRELGLRPPLVQSYGVASGSFLQVAGSAADGVVLNGNKVLVPDQLLSSDPQRQAIGDFVTAYRAAYHSSPSPFAGYAWDAVNLALAAMRAVGTDPGKVRDRLEATSGLVGVTGVYHFSAEDHSGLPQSPLVMLNVHNGAFVVKQG